MNLMRDRWMFVPVVFLGFSVVLGVTTVMVAVAGRPLGAEPDYYGKAVAWERAQAQATMNDRLRWSITPEIVAGEEGSAQLVLTLHDRLGFAVEAQHVEVEAIPVRNADRREHIELHALDAGRYTGTLAGRIAGQWEFRVTAQRGDDIYTDTFRRTLRFARNAASGGAP